MNMFGGKGSLARCVLALAASLCLVAAPAAFATTYYVDSVAGNDNNSGTSQSAPWQSLNKVNTVTFQAGDQILLKCGSVWNGQTLYPKGSGASGSPIIINTYGTGNKPQINTNLVRNISVGGNSVSTAVFLYNQAYWEISNLEITNYSATKGNYVHGVYITAQETGQVHNHIYIKNCDIHDVSAALGRGTGRDKGKNNGGICFDVYGDTVAGTKFNDIRAENCYIYNCGATGIKSWSDQFEWGGHTPVTYGTGFVARNNVLDHIDGDGIAASMTNSALIEYNVVAWSHMRTSDPYVAIWNYESNDTVMQFNECYLTQTDTDGQGFDIDDYTERTTVQYNYSHDNVGGFILIIGIKTERANGGTCDNNVVRYNISQNDGAEIVKFAGRSVHTDFYNNVFYTSGTGPATEDIVRLSDSVDAHLYNNIFENWCGANFLQPDYGTKQGFDFRRNIIYGNSDYSKWVSSYPNNQWGTNPLFVAPGAGGVGRGTCGGYMLQGGSPAINYGIWSDDPGLMALPGHPGPIGANHGSQDYFGNALPYPSGTPDSGAHEYGGGGPQPPVADFSGNPTSGPVPLTVAFTDLSTNSPTSWSWSFGDGGSSAAQHPSHQYTAANSYTVSLTATNSAGSDTETKNNYITVSSGGGGAPTFVAAGTVASGTGAITPALPAGLATNDILLLFLETANQAISISNQNGGTWTQVANSPQGTGTAGGSGATRLTVFWSRYNGTQGAPTASDSGNHQIGRIIAIRGVTTSGDPWDVTAGGVESTADTGGAIPGATTTVANCLVVAAIATDLPDANGTANFSAWANSNLTNVTERTDDTRNSGNGGGLGIATGEKATAGAYGITTVTCGASAVKGMMSIALKP